MLRNRNLFKIDNIWERSGIIVYKEGFGRKVGSWRVILGFG